MKPKVALITGCNGMDGSLLAESLLKKGYIVHGTIRRSSTFNTQRIDHIFNDLNIYHSDLADSNSLHKILEKVNPDEIYNLAAMSHVRVSFEIPLYTGDVTGLGALRILEAIRETKITPRFYQASSSEMFGKVQEIPQSETTPFWPRSPYGSAKMFAYWSTVNYRESYGMHASNGILFNHEQPGSRGETFVTRKIAKAVANIVAGKQHKLLLGNLEAKRDWGLAEEYVEGMWMMLQQPYPDDYVLATGETHTVKEFCDLAFRHAGLNYEDYVVHDDKYERPAEVDLLVGDSSKAKRVLGWEAKTKFPQLVQKMVDWELNAIK